jgi:CHASE2 domain-containing sensor protein
MNSRPSMAAGLSMTVCLSMVACFLFLTCFLFSPHFLWSLELKVYDHLEFSDPNPKERVMVVGIIEDSMDTMIEVGRDCMYAKFM